MTVAVQGAPSARTVAAWTGAILIRLGAPRAPVSVLLCGDQRMRTLNRTWRRTDSPTDVLAFAALAPPPRRPRRPGATSGHLGDLVIDVPYARRQARRRGHGLARELQILLVHGILHLVGYDHEGDDGTMFSLQKQHVLALFGKGPDGVPR